MRRNALRLLRPTMLPANPSIGRDLGALKGVNIKSAPIRPSGTFPRCAGEGKNDALLCSGFGS
jgi:hypothetical protein